MAAQDLIKRQSLSSNVRKLTSRKDGSRDARITHTSCGVNTNVDHQVSGNEKTRQNETEVEVQIFKAL